MEFERCDRKRVGKTANGIGMSECRLLVEVAEKPKEIIQQQTLACGSLQLMQVNCLHKTDRELHSLHFSPTKHVSTGFALKWL